MNLTPALLRAAVGCTADLADIYADHLADACAMHDITTPVRLAAFLAQIGHESVSLKHASEIWGPTDEQKRYEGRKDLGNTRIGDGYFFRGRGLIQCTGRDNYTKMGERLGLDLIGSPELLEQPRWAALSAAVWWTTHGCNQLADSGDFEALTRRINGGTNGLEDRLKRWEKAKTVIGQAAPTPPEPVQKPGEPVHVPPRPDQEPYVGSMPDERDNPVWTAPQPDWPAAVPTYTAPQPEKPKMAFPLALVAGLLPMVADLIPSVAKIFKPGSPVAERNVAAASAVLDTVVKATGAINAQDAIEKMKADPVVLAAATSEVNGLIELMEAGGGGIEGARKNDAAVRASGDMMHSPSFWITLFLLPLVYMVVGSVVGLWGGEWPSDVRAAIATAVVSLIVGGAAGYYWGQTTGRNRAPAS
ncbi:MAG: hypothetical protein KA185_07015 [Vitreoscilla sp.]|nr:hypothetical protein [Vitreoscilla sp.]